MEIHKDGSKVLVVTPNGVIRGRVYEYNEKKDRYTISTLITESYDSYLTLYNVKPSLVYSIEDFGRAGNFFKKRYL
jgi:hypothetical protein